MIEEKYLKIIENYRLGLVPEIWKPVKGYEEIYEISNYGRLKSLSRELWNGWGYFKTKEKYPKSYISVTGYPVYRVYKDGVCFHAQAHRLTATAFIPNPENKPEVNHECGLKIYPYPELLSWVTPKENMQHAFRTGLKKGTWIGRFGKDHSCGKSVYQYDKQGNLINEFGSANEASRKTGLDMSSICHVARGDKNYKTVGGFIWKYEPISV